MFFPFQVFVSFNSYNLVHFTLLMGLVSILTVGWTSMLLILGRDPIRIHSVFAIFRLSLFEDNQGLTLFKSLFAISSASFNVLPTAVRLVSSANILGLCLLSKVCRTKLNFDFFSRTNVRCFARYFKACPFASRSLVMLKVLTVRNVGGILTI